jgi:hypothetical protein
MKYGVDLIPVEAGNQPTCVRVRRALPSRKPPGSW